MEINLAGRSAIVTGGSKGIGLRWRPASRQSGADVAIVARGREALDAAAQEHRSGSAAAVIAVVADVASPADISRAYDEIMRAFGKVDIIVNNAGTSRAGPFENSPTSSCSRISIRNSSQRSGSPGWSGHR